MPHPLHDRWHALCTRVGAFKNAHESDMTFDMLAHFYTHPPRAYHNLDHIAQILSVYDQCFRLADDRDLVEFSLWLHDCVYIAERPDNEERSADAAAMIAGLLGCAAGFAENVRDCIMVTRHSSDPGTGDTALVADVDLSILAASTGEYDHYRRQIRREFAFAADDLFVQGRIAFLHRMLDKDHIFATRYFRTISEDHARANLDRELEELQQGTLLS
jgi:predicted metal-dependent HD superfamily phosphohydrolase